MAQTKEEHKKRHVELHKAFDELLADYITHHPDQMDILQTPLIRLVVWANEQRDNPTETKQ